MQAVIWIYCVNVSQGVLLENKCELWGKCVREGNLGYESEKKAAFRFMTAVPSGVNQKESQIVEKVTGFQSSICGEFQGH